MVSKCLKKKNFKYSCWTKIFAILKQSLQSLAMLLPVNLGDAKAKIGY